MRYATAFAAEPLPRVDLICRRTTALVEFARGRRDAGLRAELIAIRDAASQAGLAPLRDELDTAIAVIG